MVALSAIGPGMNVALVGLGRMGTVHLRAIRELVPNVALAAVAEPRAALVAASDLTGDVVVYPDASGALRHPGLDGCIVVTPTETHASIVADALELGLHVFCEKPLTLRPEESLQLQELAESRGLVLQIGFWRRFSPLLVEARRLLQEGAIGRPILLRLVQWDVDCPPAAWCDPRRSGGIFVDMGVHEYDELEWLLDARITELTAHPLALVNEELADVGDFDNALVFAGLEGGARAIIDMSRNGRYADDLRLEILGSDGALLADTVPASRLRIGTRRSRDRLGGRRRRRLRSRRRRRARRVRGAGHRRGGCYGRSRCRGEHPRRADRRGGPRLGCNRRRCTSLDD